MTYDKGRLEELAQGWEMDGGGYEPENPPDYLADTLAGCVICDSGLDYIAGDMFWADSGHCEHDIAFVAIDVGSWDREWPDTLSDGPRKGTRNRKVSEGVMYETEHECSWCGPGTGEENESTRETCKRCDGDGYTISEGGAWAAYVSEEIPESELPQRIVVEETVGVGTIGADVRTEPRTVATESDYRSARSVVACMVRECRRLGLTTYASRNYHGAYTARVPGGNYFRILLEPDID